MPAFLLISSSGASANIVALANYACRLLCPIVAFTGFGGGTLRELATVSLHVTSNDYEVVEPVHDALLHRLQYHLRRECLGA
jgi:phosphoheptose isomerase